MNDHRDIETETLALVSRIDPVDGSRGPGSPDESDTEATLGAILARVRTPEPSRRQRHRTRPRPRTLALGIGVPALAAAGVAVVLVATSGGSDGPATGSVHVVGPGSVGHGAGGRAAARDSAYVIRRARGALIAADRRRGVVLSTVVSWPPFYRTVSYLDPRNQNLYTNERAFTREGHETFANVDADVPVRGYMHFRTFTIAYDDHTWAAGSSVSAVPIQRGPVHFDRRLAGPLSPPSHVQRALSGHFETRTGTATIAGTPVLVLTGHRSRYVTVRLYVDARTYQPLREVERNVDNGSTDVTVTNVLPATPANIAKAADPPPVPRGFRRSRRLTAPRVVAEAGPVSWPSSCCRAAAPGRCPSHRPGREMR